MTTLKEKTTATERKKRKPKPPVPKALIYEMWNGKPVYYRGYQEVIAGKKSAEAIMGSSILQSRIVSTLLRFLFKQLPEDKYEILGNELGVLFKKGDWRSCDIAIYETATLADQDESKYASVPPKVVIEIDTKASLENFESLEQYYHQKTQQLLNFGVEKIVWIFTAQPQKVMIAAKDTDWRIKDWTQEIEILEGITLALAELVKPL